MKVQFMEFQQASASLSIVKVLPCHWWVWIWNRQLAPSPKRSVDQCLPMISENRRDCICCNGEASMLRQKVPSTKTHYYCSKCEVPLCLQRERNCFLKWHSPEGKVIQDWARTKGRKKKLWALICYYFGNSDIKNCCSLCFQLAREISSICIWF